MGSRCGFIHVYPRKSRLDRQAAPARSELVNIPSPLCHFVLEPTGAMDAPFVDEETFLFGNGQLRFLVCSSNQKFSKGNFTQLGDVSCAELLGLRHFRSSSLCQRDGWRRYSEGALWQHRIETRLLLFDTFGFG